MKIEDIDLKKKQQLQTKNKQETKKKKKPTTAHLFRTRDAPAVASSKKLPNLTS